MQAIVYLRRSKKSDKRTVSLEEQEESVRAYACLRGFTLFCVIFRGGVSEEVTEMKRASDSIPKKKQIVRR